MKSVTAASAVFGLFIALAAMNASAQDDRSWIEVPVIINIVAVGPPAGPKTPVVTSEDAKKAVAEASKILKQARIKLTVVKVNSGDTEPKANGGDNGDGKFTIAELEHAREIANNELNDTFVDEDGDPAHIGTKIYFTVVPDPGSDSTLGHSEHFEPSVFVRWVPTKPSKGEPKPEVATGTVIAHELAHSWSLNGGHTVTTGPNGENADPAGHTDPKTRPTNLMSPLAVPGTNPHLTDEQQAEIRSTAVAAGVEVKSENETAFPTKSQKQNGAKQDARDDQAGDPLEDLSDAMWRSLLDDPLLHYQVFMDSWIPDNQAVDFFLRMYFDADADLFTGVTLNGFEGIDREVEVHITGDGFSPPVADATLIDHNLGGATFPLAPPTFVIEDLFFDDFPDASFSEGHHRLAMDIDKAMLNLTADKVPTHIVSDSTMFGLSDSMSLTYSQNTWEKIPQLTADVVAAGLGQPVNFNGVGFGPNALATAYLDESPIATNLSIMPDGSISGSFTVCTLPETQDYFFVTLVDDADRFDFTILRLDLPFDSFEDYANGSQLHGQGGWKGWDNNPASSAPVSAVQSHSPSQSVEISGAADLVHEFCTDSNGVWSVSAWQYIPSGFDSNTNGVLAGSFFVLLNSYVDGGPHPAGNFSAQLQFDSNDGMLKVFNGNGLNTEPVPYDPDRWVKIQVIVDEDDDWTQVYYDDELVTEYPWTGGVLGGGGGVKDVAAVDLVGNGATSVHYDDIKLKRGCGQTRTDDDDADGADTATELRAGSDSCDPDTDGDGLLDGFEIVYATCVDVLTDDAIDDPDGDLLDNLGEQAADSDPCDPDTDDDGYIDSADNCPSQPNPDQYDCDANGVGDACAIAAGTADDCNSNVIDDACETISGGDFDGSGTVDLSDHTFLADCVSGPGPAPSPASAACTAMCLDAFDSDADNDVDLRDLSNFQIVFEGN